jgi:hypothetical protein
MKNVLKKIIREIEGLSIPDPIRQQEMTQNTYIVSPNKLKTNFKPYKTTRHLTNLVFEDIQTGKKQGNLKMKGGKHVDAFDGIMGINADDYTNFQDFLLKNAQQNALEGINTRLSTIQSQPTIKLTDSKNAKTGKSPVVKNSIIKLKLRDNPENEGEEVIRRSSSISKSQHKNKMTRIADDKNDFHENLGIRDQNPGHRRNLSILKTKNKNSKQTEKKVNITFNRNDSTSRISNDEGNSKYRLSDEDLPRPVSVTHIRNTRNVNLSSSRTLEKNNNDSDLFTRNLKYRNTDARRVDESNNRNDLKGQSQSKKQINGSESSKNVVLLSTSLSKLNDETSTRGQTSGKSVYQKTNFNGSLNAGPFKPSVIQLIEEDSSAIKERQFGKVRQLFDDYKDNIIVKAIMENYQPNTTGRKVLTDKKFEQFPENIDNQKNEALEIVDNENDNVIPVIKQTHDNCYSFFCAIDEKMEACPRALCLDDPNGLSKSARKIKFENRRINPNDPNYIISRYLREKSPEFQLEVREKTPTQFQNSWSPQMRVPSTDTSRGLRVPSNYGIIESVLKNKNIFNAFIGSRKVPSQSFNPQLLNTDRGNEPIVNSEQERSSFQNTNSKFKDSFAGRNDHQFIESEDKFIAELPHQDKKLDIIENREKGLISIDDYLKIKSEHISNTDITDFDYIENIEKAQLEILPQAKTIRNNDPQSYQEKNRTGLEMPSLSSNYFKNDTALENPKDSAYNFDKAESTNQKAVCISQASANIKLNQRRNISSPEMLIRTSLKSKALPVNEIWAEGFKKEQILSEIQSTSKAEMARELPSNRNTRFDKSLQDKYGDDSQSYLAARRNTKTIEIRQYRFTEGTKVSDLSDLRAPTFFADEKITNSGDRYRKSTVSGNSHQPIEDSNEFYINNNGLRIPKAVKHMTTISENISDHRYSGYSKKNTVVDAGYNSKALNPDTEDYIDDLFE